MKTEEERNLDGIELRIGLLSPYLKREIRLEEVGGGPSEFGEYLKERIAELETNKNLLEKKILENAS